MAEWEYRTSLVMERLSSNFERLLQSIKHIRHEVTDRPPSIDYESLAVEHTLSFADYRCQTSSMLLGSLR